MILWTVESVDRIFPSPQPERSIMEIDGGLLEGEKTTEGFKVSRLISTDPGLFLKEEYAPGIVKKM